MVWSTHNYVCAKANFILTFEDRQEMIIKALWVSMVSHFELNYQKGGLQEAQKRFSCCLVLLCCVNIHVCNYLHHGKIWEFITK